MTSVRWDDRELITGLSGFTKRMDQAIKVAIQYHATQAEAYARQNAPWADQTSNARNGLFAKTNQRGRSYRIIVGHSVPYGVWLEVRWSGRYAIIRPTIDREGPELMRTLSQMLSRM